MNKEELEAKEKKMRKSLLHILYHGTCKENAEKILKEGFKQYTYFSKDLASAISMGGKYVFGVEFKHDGAPDWFEGWRAWQIRNKRKIHPKHIVFLRKFNKEDLFLNKKLSHKIFNRNLKYYNEVVVELERWRIGIRS